MTGSETERLFAANLALARRLAARLEASRAKLAGAFPMPAAAFEALDEATQEALDAFLKRFEQTVDMVENRLFRGLALLEGEDLAEKSKRDLTLLMEKLGVLTDAAQWSACSILRNRLAHDYPDAPDQRCGRVVAALTAVPGVLAALDGVEARVRSRRLLPGYS